MPKLSVHFSFKNFCQICMTYQKCCTNSMSIWILRIACYFTLTVLSHLINYIWSFANFVFSFLLSTVRFHQSTKSCLKNLSRNSSKDSKRIVMFFSVSSEAVRQKLCLSHFPFVPSVPSILQFLCPSFVNFASISCLFWF